MTSTVSKCQSSYQITKATKDDTSRKGCHGRAGEAKEQLALKDFYRLFLYTQTVLFALGPCNGNETKCQRHHATS